VKKLVLSLNDAPATGRTTACELVHGLWRRQGLSHSRWHTAAEHPSGPGRSTFIDLGSRLPEDEVIGWLDQSPLVLLDVATGDAGSLIEDFVRNDLPEMLAEMECSITVLSVLDGQNRAEHSLLQLASLLRDDAEYVVARRTSAGQGWRVPGCQRAMHHLGAVEIVLPDWPATLAEAASIEGDHIVTWMARASTLPRIAQSQLRSWWLECDQSLAATADLLWSPHLAATTPGKIAPSAGRGNRPVQPPAHAGLFAE